MTATAPIGDMQSEVFALEQWEKDMILQCRQAGRSGFMVVVDPDARCWRTTGKLQCSRADRENFLPFKM